MSLHREDAIDVVGWSVIAVMLLSIAGMFAYDRCDADADARACRKAGGEWVDVSGTEVCVQAGAR